MPITAIVEGQVVAGGTATGVLYVTAAGVVASDGPTWNGTILAVGPAGDGTGTVQAATSLFAEIATPANPAANGLKVYAKDNGAGVTVLAYLDSAGTETELGSGGGIGGSTGATDNAVLRADGTGGSTLQATGVTIDDSDVVTAAEFNAPLINYSAGHLHLGNSGKYVIFDAYAISGTMRHSTNSWSLAYDSALGVTSAHVVAAGHLGLAATGGASGAIDTRIARDSAGVGKILSSTSTADSSTLGTWQAGKLTATAPSGTDVPLSLTGGSTPSANYVQVTTSGGTAGDVFKIDSAKAATFGGAMTLSTGATDLALTITATSNPYINLIGGGGVQTGCGAVSSDSGWQGTISAHRYDFRTGNTARFKIDGTTGNTSFLKKVTITPHGTAPNAMLDVRCSTASDVGLSVAPSYAGQTANLFEINALATTGGTYVKVDSAGAVTLAGQVVVDGFTAAQVGLSIVQPTTPSANAFQISSVGTSSGDMVKVDSAGAATFGGSLSQTPDATGKLTRGMASETHTLSLAATSDTTTISIPSGARLLAVQMNVDTAVTDGAGDDTWSAAFVTGSTTTIATAAAAAQNTKVNLMLPDEITSGIAEIRFTPNGGSFTAGIIQITCYYEFLTSLADA